MKGMNQLLKDMNSLQITINNIPRKDLPRAAEEGQRYAQRKAPYDTGALRDAIVLQFPKSGEIWIVSKQPIHKEGGYTGIDYSYYSRKPLPYHVWIEKGSQKVKSGANAYMKKTADYISNKLIRDVNTKLSKILK